MYHQEKRRVIAEIDRILGKYRLHLPDAVYLIKLDHCGFGLINGGGQHSHLIMDPVDRLKYMQILKRLAAAGLGGNHLRMYLKIEPFHITVFIQSDQQIQGFPCYILILPCYGGQMREEFPAFRASVISGYRNIFRNLYIDLSECINKRNGHIVIGTYNSLRTLRKRQEKACSFISLVIPEVTLEHTHTILGKSAFSHDRTEFGKSDLCVGMGGVAGHEAYLGKVMMIEEMLDHGPKAAGIVKFYLPETFDGAVDFSTLLNDIFSIYTDAAFCW